MDTRERLRQLGIVIGTDEEEALLFAEGRAAEHIKNVCNTEEIPEGLEYIAVDMACGEFIKHRALSGLLSDREVTGALKALTEGDVKVEYDNGISAVDELTSLLFSGEKELYRYRKMCW